MIIIQLKYNDTNIHSPTFQKDAYVVDVNVSTPVDGRVLLTVRAEDPDPDDNGKIEYSFAKDTNDRTKSIFGLHLNTGEITLSYALDGEEVIYRFTVVARDKGVVPKSGQTEVWVVVTGRTGNVNGSVISAVAGCLGGAVLILGVILVLCFTRLKKLRNQIQEEKLDKENMKRLFQLNQIHFQDSNQPNVRSEPFDMIDDGQIPNYNEIVDSPSGGGYNLPNDFPLPNDSDVAGESSTDIREGTSDYMHPIGTLPRSNGGLTSDGYMMAVSTSASSNATLKKDDMDYIHANSLKR
ncbi:uncharacterized protein LOC135480650 [Liolophura sinensis]|uniref:uncharacterized protein LOC135480650 n=1 Tax=Liolophura sinensis TaxID=3198878 RepID=UPI0031582527